jgi:L-cystine uptake protein TcyP (sodium:dicarboxylate symporter family)
MAAHTPCTGVCYVECMLIHTEIVIVLFTLHTLFTFGDLLKAITFTILYYPPPGIAIFLTYLTTSLTLCISILNLCKILCKEYYFSTFFYFSRSTAETILLKLKLKCTDYVHKNYYLYCMS